MNVLPQALNINLFSNNASLTELSYKSISNPFTKDRMTRVKELAQKFFTKIADFIYWIQTRSEKTDLKTIALVGCLCLVTILALSILRGKEPKKLPPAPTNPTLPATNPTPEMIQP